ncbi:MAG TPA: M48 family metalloprotease [Tepidisphaeraceae bacterium]|nr:M48 family metalloprotease [Tepidisphaeraceae bacterium]
MLGIRDGLKLSICMAALVLAVGCAPDVGNSPTTNPARPITPYGLTARRASLALARLQPFFPGVVQLRVVRSPTLGAYSEPGGRIFLTTGLAELLDDDEIAAALAHEMGHLTQTDASPNGMRFSLGGPMRDIEQRADAEALVLLDRGGVPVRAMAHTLQKLHDSRAVSNETRYALAARIALLPR